MVGPAIGFVGELVRARVTVKLCPSQPFVDSFSDTVSVVKDKGPIHTVGTPGFLFVFDNDLAESGGKSMAVIVHDCLTYMQGGLSY